jgi:hypothetical protein
VTDGRVASTNVKFDATLRSAVYESGERLASADTDDVVDVYRWVEGADPELLSGTAAYPMDLEAYSVTGDRTLMSSSFGQIPEDTDGVADLYESAGGVLGLPIPGDVDYRLEAFTPDLRRIVVSASTLTAEDTNGGIDDVYISDADLVPPSLSVSAVPAWTGVAPSIPFTGSPDVAITECSLDGGDWAPCISPCRWPGSPPDPTPSRSAGGTRRPTAPPTA